MLKNRSDQVDKITRFVTRNISRTTSPRWAKTFLVAVDLKPLTVTARSQRGGRSAGHNGRRTSSAIA